MPLSTLNPFASLMTFHRMVFDDQGFPNSLLLLKGLCLINALRESILTTILILPKLSDYHVGYGFPFYVNLKHIQIFASLISLCLNGNLNCCAVITFKCMPFHKALYFYFASILPHKWSRGMSLSIDACRLQRDNNWPPQKTFSDWNLLRCVMILVCMWLSKWGIREVWLSFLVDC